MGTERRDDAVRFGEPGHDADTLEELCRFVLGERPDKAAVREWLRDETQASSAAEIQRRLGFLADVGVLEVDGESDSERVRVTERGIRWVSAGDDELLFDLLTEAVRGFETALEALLEGPKPDEEVEAAIAAARSDSESGSDSGHESDTDSDLESDRTNSSSPADHRSWLQGLGYVERSDGVNRLTERGRRLAQRVGSGLPVLESEQYYAQSELEDAFDTSFGSYIKGINPRTDADGDLSYIIVKAREDGPYGDDLEGKRFTYVGEGVPRKGDQSLTAANKALLEHAEGTAVAPVYFFYQPADRDELRYEGLVDIVDAEYVADPAGDRMVYRFAMVELGLEDPGAYVSLAESVADGGTDSGEAGCDAGERENDADDPPLTADDEEYTVTERRVRSSAFAKRVRRAYDFRCAICGSSRESPAGTVAVEAAHVYPKQENGRDDVRNGIALCRLHHWAFDAGWLAVSDDYRVLVADRPDLEGYEEFSRLEGTELTLPSAEEERPHAAFLAAHRELHGFEGV